MFKIFSSAYQYHERSSNSVTMKYLSSINNKVKGLQNKKHLNTN